MQAKVYVTLKKGVHDPQGEAVRHTLAAMGLEDNRVRLIWASAAEGQQLAEAIDKLVDDVRALGPLRWRGNWQESPALAEAVQEIQKEHAEAMEVPA